MDIHLSKFRVFQNFSTANFDIVTLNVDEISSEFRAISEKCRMKFNESKCAEIVPNLPHHVQKFLKIAESICPFLPLILSHFLKESIHFQGRIIHSPP